AFLTSSDEILKLMMVTDAIRRANSSAKIRLEIPYLPYARQDRVCNPGEALGVRVIADLINRLNFEQVVLFDPHSDVAGALIERVSIRSQEDLVRPLVPLFSEVLPILIAPDAGAEKKVLKVAQMMDDQTGVIVEVLCASKRRDTRTGQISETTLHGSVEGRPVLIIDDICDGGRTFIELAKVLKRQGATQIYLYVTHGIFSKGLEVLEPYFDRVFCCFPFPKVKQNPNTILKILNVEPTQNEN
ncbi:MAG: ribose-phosphate diphosphokinase, partial [Verrucomicrobiota bacterium]